LISLIFVLLIWEYYGRRVNPILFTYPSAIARAFLALVATGELQSYMKESLLVLAYASILSILAGVLLGVVMGRFSIVEWAADIYVNALYSTPMVAVVPLIVLWFGFKVPAKVIIVFLFMVFPVLLNTYEGVKNVDRNLQEVARSFCSSESQLWRHLIIPSAVPFIVAGVRLAIGRGLYIYHRPGLYDRPLCQCAGDRQTLCSHRRGYDTRSWLTITCKMGRRSHRSVEKL
jgi:NitT/TauT family transport system permease protein